MSIQFNGKIIPFHHPLTLEEVLRLHHIDVHTRGIAISVNETLILKERWKTLVIQVSDRIEMIHAVQGG